MTYRIKSLLLFLVVFTSLTLYQNCGGGNSVPDYSSESSTSDNAKFSLPSTRILIGDIAIEKARIGTTNNTNGFSSASNSSSDISSYQVNLWPKGEVLYKFDSSANSIAKDAFINACTTWELESQSAVKCIPLAANSALKTGYLLITYSSNPAQDCYADLGVAGDVSRLVLANTCTDNNRMLNLVGHTLGLIDQQLRPDRNSNVKTPSSGSEAQNFVRFNSLSYSLSLQAYDFASVMNHPFSGTYQPIDGKLPQSVNINSVGNLASLSADDKSFIKLLYGVSGASSANTNRANSPCPTNQLITWGFGCYYALKNPPAVTPGKSLAPFSNQNPDYDMTERSQAQVKCVNGTWQTQNGSTCTKTLSVTGGTGDQLCAQATLSWPDSTASNSLCYASSPEELQLSQPLGKAVPIITTYREQTIGYGIFECQKSASGVPVWKFQQSYQFKNDTKPYPELYKSTKQSFCYTNQNDANIFQCPSNMKFDWKSKSGQSCSGSTITPIVVGGVIYLSSDTLDGGIALTCIRTVSGEYKLFVDLSASIDGDYCGLKEDKSRDPLDPADQPKKVKCLPTTRLMKWKDNFLDTASECEAPIKISGTYFEDEPYIYLNNLEYYSFDSKVALVCIKNPAEPSQGIWEIATKAQVTTSKYLPSPVCKKACLPNPKLEWASSTPGFNCNGATPPDRKFNEGEPLTVKATNVGVTPDSQTDFICDKNGKFVPKAADTNKCELR